MVPSRRADGIPSIRIARELSLVECVLAAVVLGGNTESRVQLIDTRDDVAVGISQLDIQYRLGQPRPLAREPQPRFTKRLRTDADVGEDRVEGMASPEGSLSAEFSNRREPASRKDERVRRGNHVIARPEQ